MDWRIINSSYSLNTKWLKVRKDHVRMPSGVEMDDFYILEYPDWINVIAITEDGQFILERQYRHGLQSIEMELCAGIVEAGEEPLAAAQRELMEETGYGGGEWSFFMKSAPNHAAMTNVNYTFIAKGVKKLSQQHLERTENIEILLMPREELIELMQFDTIIEGVQSAPLWRYFYNESINKQ